MAGLPALGGLSLPAFQQPAVDKGSVAGSMFSGVDAGIQQQNQLRAQKMQFDQEKFRMDQQKIKAEQDEENYTLGQLGMFGKMARSNKAFANDPNYIKRMSDLAKKVGIPIQYNADGSINLDGIPGSGGVNDFDVPQRKEFLAQTEPQRRALYPGLSDEAYKAPRELGAGENTAARNGLQKALHDFSLGNGTVSSLSLALTAAQGAYTTSEIDTMIQQIESPDFAAQMGPMVEAKIAEMRAKGIGDAALAAYRKMLTTERPKQIAAQLAHLRNGDAATIRKLDQGDRRLDQNAVKIQNQAAQFAQSLQQRTRQIDANVKRANDLHEKMTREARNPVTNAQASALVRSMATDVGAAEKTYGDLVKQRDTIISSRPNDANEYLGINEDGTNAPDGIEAKLEAAQASLQAARDASKQLTEQLQSNASAPVSAAMGGKSVKTSGGAGGKTVVESRKTKDGRTLVRYSDGTYGQL